MRQLSIGVLVASLLGFGMSAAVAAPLSAVSADTSAAIAPVTNSALNGQQIAPTQATVTKQVEQHQPKQTKHYAKKAKHHAKKAKHHGKKHLKKKQ